MAKKIEKICLLCGRPYSIWCPTCREGINQPGWKMLFHDENCKTIHHVCSMFNAKRMTYEDARITLAECDLSNKDNFNETVKRLLGEIGIEELVSVEESVTECSESSFEVPETVVCGQEVLSVVEEEILPVEPENSSNEEMVVLAEETTPAVTHNYKKRKKKNR